MASASADLRQTLRSAATRLGLAAFWRWWMGELAPLVPAAFRAQLARRRLRPIVAFEADAAVVWTPRVAGGALGFAETARIALSGDPVAVASAGRAATDALPRAAYAGTATPASVLVALPPSQVLRKTISFPAAVEENLHQMLAYELDRHTPFKPDEVYFDAVVVGRDPAKKEIRVDWSAALRNVVDQARRRVESWGAQVVGVTPESPAGVLAKGGGALNLLPAAERPDASMWRRWQVWVPVLAIAIAALLATALPLWQKRAYAIALMHLADQSRAQADASSALREQLEQLTGDYNFALRRKYAFPPAVQVVDDVSKLLPDDTWLTQFELKTTSQGKDPRREIVVRGESANAGRLVTLFEDSKVFGETAPRSPTTKIQGGSGEIFDLGAQLKPLALPELVLVAGVSDGDIATPPAPVTPAAALPAMTPPSAPAPTPGPPSPATSGVPALKPGTGAGPAGTANPSKPGSAAPSAKAPEPPPTAALAPPGPPAPREAPAPSAEPGNPAPTGEGAPDAAPPTQ